MSFITKVFIILSVILVVVFALLAGSLVAKQENFKERFTRERVEREKDTRLQNRMADRLAALLEEKRRQIALKREEVLVLQGRAQLVQEQADAALQDLDATNQHLESFQGISGEFPAILESYENTINGLMEKVRTLSERHNTLVDSRATMFESLAKARADVARMREHINELDYNLFKIQRLNSAKRETITLYREIDPSLGNFGAMPGLMGAVTLVRADEGFTLVSINIGARDGVQRESEFSVFRGDAYIARLRITDPPEPNRSIGLVLPGAEGVPRAGDVVRPSWR